MIADPAKSTLIIVESPTKANTISRYLPKSCTVMASKGHVVELAPNPTTGVYGVDVDNGYALEYVIEDDKKKVLADMRKALKGKEQLILATDEDREGESISWQLLNQLKPACPVFRMVFHEITKQAITKAFSSCREIDMDLVAAQEARRTVDRLQGYGISPMLSRKLGGKYSAGRVQSPGLKLIVEREKTRRGFVSSAYASVEAELSSEGSVFPALLTAIDETPVASSKSYDKETGRLNAPGRPALFAPTDEFYSRFDLKDKDSLPKPGPELEAEIDEEVKAELQSFEESEKSAETIEMET